MQTTEAAMRAQTCGSRALDSRKNILEIGGRVVQGWEHKKGDMSSVLLLQCLARKDHVLHFQNKHKSKSRAFPMEQCCGVKTRKKTKLRGSWSVPGPVPRDPHHRFPSGRLHLQPQSQGGSVNTLNGLAESKTLHRGIWVRVPLVAARVFIKLCRKTGGTASGAKAQPLV